MITLRALGNAEIETSVTTLTPSQEIVFAAALYLVLERGKRVSRTGLASLLWPRGADTVRSHRLRQTILQLKKLGIIVQADRDKLQLLMHDAQSDLDPLSGTSPTLPATYSSLEFLPGYAPRFSEAFRDWVDAKRGESHAAITRILVRRLEEARLKGDWSGVDMISSHCLALDCYNETAVLAQAEASAMRGGKKKAVETLDRYIAELGTGQGDLKLPATLLRRRVVERFSEGPTLRNAEPQFVGREAEMQVLISRFEAARAGKGSGVLVVGEPGIGKSRISDELARFAELQGAQVHRTACRRTDLNRPLSLFVDIVPELREMPGALGCSPETLASLKRLTDFQLRSRDSNWSPDSETLFGDLRNALFDLFDSLAEERCLVVVIEDIHWLDDVSANILARMIERAPSKRLLFILNSRPTDNSSFPFAGVANLRTLSLGPLAPIASTAVLHCIASRPDDHPEHDVLEWCVGVAEGNPFFLQELAHHWLETGHKYEAPSSVTIVLEQRLARLSEEALQLLQCCSVLGEHATLERVEAVLEYHSHQILSAVEELSKAAMLGLHREGLYPDGRLRPRHDLLSSAAVQLMAEISLAFLHRRAAEVLELEIAQETKPTTLLWACANHRHCAGDRQKALTLTISCAEHLLDVGLAGDASTAFRKALDYCVTDEQRLEVLPRLGVALQLNGDWASAKDVLKSCIRLARKATPGADPHNEYELQLFAARHQSAFDFSSLLADIVPCVESPGASPSHRVYAAVMALKIATDIGPAEMLDSIYGCVAPLLTNGDVDESSRLEVEVIYRTTRCFEAIPTQTLQQFVDASRIHRGELAYSNALLTAAAACRISARYEEGLAFITQAFKHAVSHKRLAQIPRVLVAETRLHLAAGAYDRADATLTRMIEGFISPDDTFAQTELNFYTARVALEKNELERASAAFAEVQETPRTYSPRRRAHSLAIGLHLGLRKNLPQSEIRVMVSDLEAEHLKIRTLGGQDFEAYALHLGLCAIGETTRALTLMTEYVSAHRRSEWPLPREIQSALSDTTWSRGADLGGDRLKGSAIYSPDVTAKNS